MKLSSCIYHFYYAAGYSTFILFWLVSSRTYLSCSSLSDVNHADVTIHSIAFGSCHKRKYAIREDLSTLLTQSSSSSSSSSSNTKTIWSAIAMQNPDIFLWTGDAIYPPKRGIASLELLQNEYQQLLTNASLGYTNFHPPHGIYGTWDDHDYGGNDMGNQMPQKLQRAKLFSNFLQNKTKIRKTNNHNNNNNDVNDHQPTVSSSLSSTDTRPGVYQSIEFGTAPHKVKIILLDTRWHRTSHCIPSLATVLPLGAGIACVTRWLTAGLASLLFFCHESKDGMLGSEQWKWLEQEFHTSTAQVHVLVSSVQVLTTNPVMESWGHFPKERKRLLQLFNQHSSGLVVLSGDVHHAEILNPAAYQYTRHHHQSDDTTHTGSSSSSSEPLTPFLEVTSSGLTHDCSRGIYGLLCRPLLNYFSQHRHGHDNHNINSTNYYYIGRNYGMIHLDWDNGTFRVDVHSLEKSDFNKVVLTTGLLPLVRMDPNKDDTGLLDVDQVLPCINGHLIPFLQKAIVTLIVLLIVTMSLWTFVGKRVRGV